MAIVDYRTIPMLIHYRYGINKGLSRSDNHGAFIFAALFTEPEHCFIGIPLVPTKAPTPDKPSSLVHHAGAIAAHVRIIWIGVDVVQCITHTAIHNFGVMH